MFPVLDHIILSDPNYRFASYSVKSLNIKNLKLIVNNKYMIDTVLELNATKRL